MALGWPGGMEVGRAEAYLSTIQLDEKEQKLGVYVYHKELLKLLPTDTNGRTIVPKYRSIVSSSEFNQVLALVGIGFAILDIVLDWCTIIYYNSGWPMGIAIVLLVIGYFFNIFYLVTMREMTLSFQSTFLKCESTPQTPVAQKLHTFFEILVQCWQWLICNCDRRRRNPSSRLHNAEPNAEMVQDLSAMQENNSEINDAERVAISSAFVNVNSARIILLGITSAFLSPSIFMNYHCWLYMKRINRSLSGIEVKDSTQDSRTWLHLHCEAFILFGLSYISKESHNIELLTETLPQLILQLYMVLDEPFNSPLGFNQSLDIPLWRSTGFFLSFLAIGNAMRSSVVGKWEYYHYEHASSSELELNTLSKCFSYSPSSHLINLLGHTCILSSTAVAAALCFLYSAYLGFSLFLLILFLPTLKFLITGASDSDESWANRYMWFFTRVFSCLDSFSPSKRLGMLNFVKEIGIRIMFYAAILGMLSCLKPDIGILCILTFSCLIVGYGLLLLERLYFKSHFSLRKIIRVSDLAEGLLSPA